MSSAKRDMSRPGSWLLVMETIKAGTSVWKRVP